VFDIRWVEPAPRGNVMLWKQLFARKSLERLLGEAQGENRLRRVLGPISLTALGVGAIIGAGIFVTTGETAANKAGPAVMLSYLVAGLGCALAAFCYAEFASMAPVAGSAYTYAYATLGELFAWIIGWDLILEYAMSCGVLAADWTKYFNVFLKVFFHWQVPEHLSSDPFSTEGAWFSMPAVFIMAASTVVLVIGIRESATTNAVLVITKVGVVLFVIGVGVWYVQPAYWTQIPPQFRKPTDVPDLVQRFPEIGQLLPEGPGRFMSGKDLLEEHPEAAELMARSVESDVRKLSNVADLSERPDLARFLPRDQDFGNVSGQELLEGNPRLVEDIESAVKSEIKKLPSMEGKWGMIGLLGLNQKLEAVDDRVRNPFMPYGLSGILVAAAAVFFAYIGFDAISTHSEEAKKPQRDVPIGILSSLAICSVLYFGVSAVITGMEPYPVIDPDAAVAEAFHRRSEQAGGNLALRLSAGLIATGALAGMTSVILITLLSQARIFLAMARDGLMPPMFGAVHPRFRTPHLSTMVTGGILCVVTALTPIDLLFNMVNIGTLLAFAIVCGAVLLLRIRRPEAERPFRCPWVYVLAPLGIAVNVLMMLFLPVDTWLRLVGWLVIGMVIYFGYGYRHTIMARAFWKEEPGNELLSEDSYFYSEAYRQRVRFSLLFCAAIAGLSLVGLAAVEINWHRGTLGPLLTFEPVTVVWLMRATALFAVFMLVMNLLEWQRPHSAPAGLPSLPPTDSPRERNAPGEPQTGIQPGESRTGIQPDEDKERGKP
jgi:APA family basic amino acid/polyamine antiporter